MRNLIVLAAVATTLAVAPANAVTVVNATSIQINNALTDYLQIAEVVATAVGTGVDVAASANGGTASSPDQYTSFTGAEKAIDGNLLGNFYGPQSIYHSATGDGSTKLTINFAAPTSLSSLTIFGRTDCCQQRDIYNVSIFGGTKLLYSGSVNSIEAPGTVTFDVSTVPEPATWGLMIAGFGMTGYAARRRRTALTA